MKNKVIDFKKSKEKLINKKADLEKKAELYLGKSYKDYLEFKNKYEKCKEKLFKGKKVDDNDVIQILSLYGSFFEKIYSEWNVYDSKKSLKLKEAMDYAMLSSGKRLRPFLMYLTFDFCKGDNDMALMPFMVALEMIHNFSLIHDDLPCIDNDELRRGKETVWKKYGEDIAVLTGDALLMQANSIMLKTINEFGGTIFQPYFSSVAYLIMNFSGANGMLQGEFIDVVNSNNKKLSLNDIFYLNELKTTALFYAAILGGATLSLNAANIINQLDQFASMFGKAFQIQDDLLEVTGNEKIIGKSIDSDKKNGKITIVSKIGVKESEKLVSELFDGCINAIEKCTTKENVKEALFYKKFIDFIRRREK